MRGASTQTRMVLNPCDEDAEPWEEKRQDEEPEWNRVNGEGKGEFHS
jgi:hypothetical protein